VNSAGETPGTYQEPELSGGDSGIPLKQSYENEFVLDELAKKKRKKSALRKSTMVGDFSDFEKNSNDFQTDEPSDDNKAANWFPDGNELGSSRRIFDHPQQFFTERVLPFLRVFIESSPPISLRNGFRKASRRLLLAMYRIIPSSMPWFPSRASTSCISSLSVLLGRSDCEIAWKPACRQADTFRYGL
jgi:hypothetical protein